MNRNKREARRSGHALRLWTLSQARAALPYVGSVVRSAREHALEVKQLLHRSVRLEQRPGRPGRQALIALSEAQAEAAAAARRLEAAVAELQAIDVYCLEPVRGEAFIPFVHQSQLAWFVFDLFDTDALRFWRYDEDDADMRRLVADIPQGESETSLIA